MMRTRVGSGFGVRGSGHVPTTQNPQPRTRNRGQIAVGFLVIAAFTLLLVRMTINLGQMAQVRTETSNAADAGALAAASWIASGENEAALIAGRMLDLVGMVQAIYIVPFCPGDGARAYADRLWQSLDVHPDLPLGAVGPLVQLGPVRYLWDVADAAMIGAWHVGRREFFTAAVNNMIIRYPTGPDEYMGPGGIGVDMDGSVPKKIREAQDSLNDGMTDQAALAWNNGLPVDNPKFLQHHAQFQTDNFPPDPPRLNMACNDDSRATYHQYRPKQTIPIWGETFFDCDFVGVGITDTETTGPVVNINKVSGFPDNPLAVVPDEAHGGWVKAWDLIDFAPAIPSFEHDDASMRVTVGICSDHVCGIEPQKKTACASVRPTSIVDGANTITVRVSHEVTTNDGFAGGGLFGAIPSWEPRFQRVESGATAEYTAASTFPPNPNAKATLEGSE